MKKLMIFLLTLIFILSGCVQSGTGALSEQDSEIMDEDTTQNKSNFFEAKVIDISQQVELNSEFVNGNNEFGLNLLRKTYSQNENTAVSPSSIELALLMCYAGASGETAEQIQNVMKQSGLSYEQVIQSCSELMKKLNYGGMQASNSIWLQDDFPIKQEYIDLCTQDFFSEAAQVDFSDPETRQLINDWINQKTNGKIEKMSDEPFDPLTVLVLVNALYFFGEWELPFKEEATIQQTFYAPQGEVMADMMRDQRHCLYSDEEGYEYISLPFKESTYSMAFLLPDEGMSAAAMLETLNPTDFDELVKKGHGQEVNIMLPKFEFEYTINLVEMLESMGMQKAFDETKAEFGDISDGRGRIFINDVSHKCYIKVDEIGAEAAAITEVEMAARDGMPEPVPEFHADRPFVFVIYDRLDGTIVFMGIINNPLE